MIFVTNIDKYTLILYVKVYGLWQCPVICVTYMLKIYIVIIFVPKCLLIKWLQITTFLIAPHHQAKQYSHSIIEKIVYVKLRKVTSYIISICQSKLEILITFPEASSPLEENNIFNTALIHNFSIIYIVV